MAKAKAAGRARKAAKPKAAKRRSPVAAFQPKATARPQGQSGARAARPTCPVCGSRDVETRKLDRAAKSPTKFVAGVRSPILVERPTGLVCHSCGFREEAGA